MSDIGLFIIAVFSFWLACFSIGISCGLIEECLQDRYQNNSDRPSTQ
ncbi:MAG: hypothetical protein Q4F00_11180 [bacterium]|nr:hypothetical protein [bacterium]